jgi:hypothetical protein
MMIDRRAFVAGSALGLVTPTLGLSLTPPQRPAMNAGWPVLVIENWRVQAGLESEDEVSIRLDHRWRAAWR